MLRLQGKGSRDWPGPAPRPGEYLDLGALWLVDSVRLRADGADVFCYRLSETLEHDLRRAWASWGDTQQAEPVDDESAELPS
jgi:hypothetical protein